MMLNLLGHGLVFAVLGRPLCRLFTASGRFVVLLIFQVLTHFLALNQLVLAAGLLGRAALGRFEKQRRLGVELFGRVASFQLIFKALELGDLMASFIVRVGDASLVTSSFVFKV